MKVKPLEYSEMNPDAVDRLKEGNCVSERAVK
jgi:hypothetical protein